MLGTPIGRTVRLAGAALAGAMAVVPAGATDAGDRTSFIEANVLAIFYHELAHATIDLLDVPIFGQEEDAADVMAVLLIDRMFEEAAARDLAADSAFGYLDAEALAGEGAPPDYWDLHGPDEQRFYNHVCLFYGADPEGRAELAGDMGLPEERAETCADEFAHAADAWESVFAEMEDAGEAGGGAGLALMEVGGNEPGASLLARTLREEIAALNEALALPEPVRVRVEPCGEANAFYDPQRAAITMCTEFVAYLERVFEAVEE